MKSLILSLIFVAGCITASAQSCCSALTPAMSTTVSGKTVTLYNNSTVPSGSGLYVGYIINWGDGTCWGASQKTPLSYTYSCPGTYTVRLEVRVFDSSINTYCCIKTTSKKVYLNGPSLLDCSKVKASMSVSVSGDKVTLVNNSTPTAWCNQTASYSIRWGDPQGAYGTSKIGTYTHTYKYSGTYNVRLIFKLKDHIKSCSDTVDANVTVTVVQPNVISGYAKADINTLQPNDKIKLWLMKYNSASQLFSPIDSIEGVPNTSGYISYKFRNKSSGKYIIKAERLGQFTGRNNIPVYAPFLLSWDKAIITHKGDSVYMPITLKQGKPATGPGVISGDIKYDGSQYGVAGVNVLLLDSVSVPVAYAVTDGDGKYSFNNLPEAKYTIHPDDLNYNTTPTTLNVTAAQPVSTGVDFRRYSSSLVIVPVPAGVSQTSNGKLSFTIYPNPASDKVVLNWAGGVNGIATVNITDISGKKVYSTKTKMQGQSVIEFGELQAGFYMLNVSSDLGSSTHKLLIQH